MEWKDDTSYSYVEGKRRGQIPPSVLSTTLQEIRIVVHKHIYTGDKWNISCKDLLMDTRPLQSLDLEEAKKEALTMVYDKVAEKIHQLKQVRDSIRENLTL